MPVKNIRSVIEQLTAYDKNERRTALLSGALVGTLIAQKLIEADWSDTLWSIASRTWMGEMRSGGINAAEFVAGLNSGSEGRIIIQIEDLPHPELMMGRHADAYARAINDLVAAVWAEGFGHYIRGISYSPEEGKTHFLTWCNEAVQIARQMLTAEESV